MFKGGTALRKCYFGDSRLSEGLDFTGRSGVPIDSTLSQMVTDACADAARLLDSYALVQIATERSLE